MIEILSIQASPWLLALVPILLFHKPTRIYLMRAVRIQRGKGRARSLPSTEVEK